MKKKQTQPSISSWELSDESPFAAWISEHGNSILYGIAIAIACIAAFFWFNAGKSAKAEGDYMQATAAMTRILAYPQTEQDVLLQKNAVVELQQILENRPNLQSKYDGQLVQYFLLHGNLADAHKYADRTLARTSQDNLPDYTNFSKNTLAIAHEDYQSALTNSEQLNTTMTKGDTSFGDALYVFNLIRIAELQNKIGNKEAELKAWDGVIQLTQNEKAKMIKPQVVERVLSHMDVQGSTLVNYIQNRK